MSRPDPKMLKHYRRENLHRIIMAMKQGQVIPAQLPANSRYGGNTTIPFLERLTSREFEILSLLTQGYTNSAIAETLLIDMKTVEQYLQGMYHKLEEPSDFNDHDRHLRVNMARLYCKALVEEITPGMQEMRLESGLCN